MTEDASVAVLSVGQNGQITVPAAFRKEHALGRGGKVVVVRMGDALVNQLARQWEEEFDLLCLLLANSLVVHTEETGWPWLRCGR